MYLQTARYVLKSYLAYLAKKKVPSDSVKYITRFELLTNVRFTGGNDWTVEELRDLLVKSLAHVLGVVVKKIQGKSAGESERKVLDHRVGIRLQQLAQLHAVWFVVNSFIEAIDKSAD
jgi:hypothetical protein